MFKKLREQSGSALIVTLGILVMLVILGIAAIRNSSTDMSISYSGKAKTLSFYSAQAGLAHAISIISNSTKPLAGSISLTQMTNGTSYSASWTAMDTLTGVMTLTATGYKGNSNSPDGKTILKEKIDVIDANLDNVITIPNFGAPPDDDGDDVPLKFEDNAQVFGKIRIDAPPGNNGKQVAMEGSTGGIVNGVVNITINGVTYTAKVNNPVNNGTPNQFTITIGGTNYAGTVTWDNVSNPTTGTASIVIGGSTYSGIAKPGAISITGGSNAYSGPTTGSGNLGFLNLNQTTQPPPDLGASTIQTLGQQGAATGGYNAPSGKVTFGNGNQSLNKVGGGNIQYYDGSTHTIDFTVIPGGILYLPGGFDLSQTIYFKGLGTIVIGSGEVEIEQSILPATGFAENSSLGLVSNSGIEMEGEHNPITVYAHIYTRGTHENEIEDNVTFYGSIVAPRLEVEGDDDHNNNTTKLYYRKPKGTIPGLSYLSSKFILSAKKGSWMEQVN